MKIINVVGARPNFMKIAPLIEALKKYPSIKQVLVHTGQHYDYKLSKIFFDELNIPEPDINLEAGSGGRDYQIKEISERFKSVLLKEKPDLVVVVGDVNSTIACASAAKESGVKVAHIEAGLRSFDLSMPEELNRIETDKISDFLFITEEGAFANLAREGISKNKIFFVGNVMIDTLIRNIEKSRKSRIIDELGLEKKNFIVSTIHRPSNVDKKKDLLKILEIFEEIQNKIKIILPLHPRTRKSIQKFQLDDKIRQLKNLIITEPLGYLDFLSLISNSKGVITDSGGVQEETTYLRIPCITMRSNTERPETITKGTNLLVGSSKSSILDAFNQIMDGTFKRGDIPKFWDGNAAERIAKILITNQ